MSDLPCLQLILLQNTIQIITIKRRHPFDLTEMPKAVRGVLVECDASIKAIIVKIDSERNDIIVEDLDDEHLVIKETKLEELRQRLNQTLKTTLREAESSDSE
ncbi:transcription factor TFIIH complex subunit Tfb5-domain-containing protein [Cenococcum geophilum]